ncbi:MAG: DUF1905 domain-containing protein [Novosphingobium sp.]|nr:DUF1905 domain-containing protein [Novosphingobium sp.]
MNERVTFSARLWRWTGAQNGTWHFLTVTGEEAEAIATHALMHKLETGAARGFGSVRVNVTIGSSTWRTSVFPSKERGGWILPVKRVIRRAEDLAEGDTVQAELELL